MAKVVVDVSMSLDGFIAGPDDDRARPLGGRGATHIFDWYFSGKVPYEGTMFRPQGNNRTVVAEMFQQAGAMLTGRRTYEIANGWNGTHPVNAIPIVILTHKPPPTFPKGKSEIVFVTDGIESGVSKAKALAKNKHVGIGGASVAQQALKAGLVDELLLHIAPILLGEGVRLFEHLGDEAIRLRKIGSLDAEDTSHLRYEVLGH
ncbi:MAG: dihydrofolate reductase family protein [Steroidobacteraceae bacterium]|jgi:dihydrofolate reductase